MNHWMSILLSLSLSGVVLTLVLLALTRLLGRRLGRRWQYYVWGIVVLRLLLSYSSAGRPARNASAPGGSVWGGVGNGRKIDVCWNTG